MKIIKMSLVVTLAILMMASATFMGFAKADFAKKITTESRLESGITYVKENFESEFNSSAQYPQTADMWSLLCAYSAGKQNDSDYAFLVPEFSATNFEDSTYITEYSKAIISLVILGKDPTNLDGLNLVEKLIQMHNTADEFTNTANVLPYTIIALEIAKADYDNQSAVNALTSLAKTDGGYSWDTNSLTGDIDTTGPVMVALSLTDYGKSKMAPAVEFIKSCVDDNGYFVSPGGYTSGANNDFYSNVANANSQAMAIIGLLSAAEDLTDAQVEAFYALQTDEGGFIYNTTSTTPDYYSTHQAIVALAAIKTAEDNKINNTSSIDSSAIDSSGVSITLNNQSTDGTTSIAKTSATAYITKTGDTGINIKFIIIAAVAFVIIAACALIPVFNKKKKPDANEDNSDEKDKGEDNK